MDHSNPAPATTPAKAQRVLVLQGGGALGSYQGGAFQALCRAGFDASQGSKLGVILASFSPIDAVANCRHGADLFAH